jgi:hypothetical protein
MDELAATQVASEPSTEMGSAVFCPQFQSPAGYPKIPLIIIFTITYAINIFKN